MPKHWGWVGRNEPDISPIVVSQVPYTPWSDNSTWAAHGVPSTLFMSWPDEYFHSQLLTVEVTDPSVFAYSGALVAASAYEVAAAGAEEAYWLAHWIYAKSAARLYRERQSRLWIRETAGGDAWMRKRVELSPPARLRSPCLARRSRFRGGRAVGSNGSRGTPAAARRGGKRHPSGRPLRCRSISAPFPGN